MTLQEGFEIIKKIPNQPFKTIFQGQDLTDIIKNKGKTGQLMETIILKLKLSNKHLDFTDGELKTNKSKADGTPDETMAICQISSLFDDMLDDNFDLDNNYIIEKLNNMIYVQVDKSSKNPEDWKIFPPQHVTITDNKYMEWYKKIKNDLFEICTIIKQICESGKMLHSTKGPGHYIQIRTKDSNPYHPIFSKRYNRFVSDKNFAIYITTEGLKELVRLNGVD